jgi:hypothetical protein
MELVDPALRAIAAKLYIAKVFALRSIPKTLVAILYPAAKDNPKAIFF